MPPLENKPLYPLPVPWLDCTRPEQLIPEAALRDPLGYGARAWEIAQRIRVTEGEWAGRRFGEVAEPWQELLIRAIWGHRDPNGQRIIQRVVLKTARKSGKTFLASILAFTEVIMSEEARGQVLLIGAEQKQSDLAYHNISSAIEADARLKRRFQVTPGYKRILDRHTNTMFWARSGDAKGNIGAGANVAIIDELHVIGTMGQKGTDLVHAVESGMLARRDRLIIYITTAPRHVAGGIYREIMDHARQVLTGKVADPRTLVVLFEIPPALSYEDPVNWWRANPNIGRTIFLQDLLETYDRAKTRGFEAEAEFLSQNLNVEPQERDSGPEVWIDRQMFRLAVDPAITLEFLKSSDLKLAAGIDIGGARDFTSLALIGWNDQEQFYLWTHNWLSEQGWMRWKHAAPLAEAIDAGELTIVPTVGEDIQAMMDVILSLWGETGQLIGVGADPHGMKGPAVIIHARTGIQVLAVPQGYRMNPWIDAFERALYSGCLKVHSSNLLEWQVGNAHVQAAGEARRLTKPEDQKEAAFKIDAVIAAVSAWAAMEDGPDPDRNYGEVGSWIG